MQTIRMRQMIAQRKNASLTVAQQSTMQTMSADNSLGRGPSLRLVCFNDVYTLDNLPRLLNLVRHHRAHSPADRTLVTLAGDFIGPSMLSSLDKGRSMIECLNAIGVTHVIFGNHEDDIEPSELRQRIAEFSGTWLATNTPEFQPTLPAHDIITVQHPAGRSVRVGLVGVVMSDETVYRRRPFGGVSIEPQNACALQVSERLLSQQGVCCVIPLTHQDLEDDRVLAQTPLSVPFPAVIGGHEHKVYLEQYGSTWLIKAGCDAIHAAIVDLVWPAEAPVDGQDLPTVTVTLDDSVKYPDDEPLRALVNQRMQAVKALEAATLLPIPEGVVLSSIGTRVKQTSVGTLLCTRIRDALHADGCLLNGGGVRGNREYRKIFTYGNLKAELPFDNEIVVVPMPGSVLQDAIVSSRASAPNESGGFLQVDDRIVVADEPRALLQVAGQPFDRERTYRIAIMRNLMFGMDHIEPLSNYTKQNPGRVPPDGSGRDIKLVLIDAFSVSLWQQLGGFASVDTDHDGRVTDRELAQAVSQLTSEPASPITIELMMRAIDKDHDGSISIQESAALGNEKPAEPTKST